MNLPCLDLHNLATLHGLIRPQAAIKRLSAIAFILLIFCCILILLSPPRPRNFRVRRTVSTLNDTSLIVYRVYADTRRPDSTVLRVLAFSQCRNISLTVQMGRESYNAVAEPIEGTCPWSWAPKCKWVAFMLIAGLPHNRSLLKSVVLKEEGRSTELRVHEAPSNKYRGLHVCVPPLYWYSDHIALVQFFEVWKAHGVSHFFVYYQSISRTVLEILQAYQRKKIATLIKWRLLPQSNIDPNLSVYRIGHVIAHNDCLMRSEGEFVALVDVDEYIIPKSSNLHSFLKKSLKSHPIAGSFVFEHSRLRYPNAFNKSIENRRDVDFSWLSDSEFEPGNGPPKVIFLPQRIEVILTHEARIHLSPYIQVSVKPSEALLYHSRSNWAMIETPGNFTRRRLFSRHLAASVARTYKILTSSISSCQSSSAHFRTNVASIISNCLSNWQEVGCKTPISTCRGSLQSVEDWVYSNDDGSPSPYTVL